MESIIKVKFRKPPLPDNPKTEFYFGSLAAIYETFEPEQIGCKVGTLWNANITDEKPYCNRLCEVSREKFARKAQNTPSRKQKFVGQ